MLTSFFDEALGNQGISPKSQNSSKAFHEILLFLELPKLCKNVLEELPCGGLYFDQKWTPPAFRLTLDPTAKLLSFQLIFQLVNCWKMSQTLVGKWDRIMRFHCWIDHPMILLWRKMMLFTLIFREFLFRRLWEWEMETERLWLL